MSLTDSSSSFGCSAVYGFSATASTNIQCTRSSVTVVRVSNAFPNTDTYMQLNLNNVLLPSYVSTFTVQVASYTSANVQIDTSAGSTFSFTTSAGSLSLSLTSLTSQVVGEYTSLQIAVGLQNTVATTGYLLMQFPKWNSGTQNLGLVSSMIQTSQSDTLVNGAYKIDCSSSSHPNLVCLATINNPSSISTIASTFDTLRISGFASSLSGTFTFSLTNSRFKNPPSTKPTTGISISSYNLGGQMIDTLKTQFSYAPSTAATLATSQVTITMPSSTVVNQRSVYNILIKTPLPLPIGTSMQIKIPSQVLITSSASSSQIVINSAVGFSPLYSVIEVIVKDSSTQTIELNNLVPFAANYADVDTLAQIQLVQLTNPSSTATTDPFIIQFYDQSHMFMQSTSVTVQATAGPLSSVSIVANDYRTRASAQYTFSFAIANALTAGCGIRVQMPAQFFVSSSSLRFVSVLAVTSAGVISYDSTNRYIIISNAFAASVASGTIVRFTITNGIINPITSKQTDAFVLSTLDATGNVIDSNEAITITPTPNELPDVVVTACSDKPASSYTSQQCVYGMRIYPTVNMPILANSFIRVTIPEELTFTSQTDSLKYSYSEGVEDSSLTLSQQATKVLDFKNLFSPQAGSSITTYTLNSFALFITNLTTPRSTQPTSTFKVYIYDSEGNIQYQKTSLIYSAVAAARPFTRALVSRNNEVNGATGVTYQFTFQNSQPVSRNEYIVVVPPSLITFKQTTNTCVGVSSLQSSLSCTLGDGSLIINIQPSSDVSVDSYSLIAAGTLFILQVNNVTNPLSDQPTDSFQLYLSTSRVPPFYYVNQATQGLAFINAKDGLLRNVIITADSLQFSVVTSYTFYITTTNIIPSNGYIEVQFPQVYGTFSGSLVSCSAIQNIPAIRLSNSLQCRLSSKYTVQIINGYYNTELSAGQVIGFKFLSIRNPSQSYNSSIASNQIVIRTKSSDGFTIDESEGVDFSIGCASPCSQCKTNPSTCTSCIQTDPLNPYFLFQSSCGLTCPAGYYDDKLLTCQKCTFPCSGCMTNSSFCTACTSSSGLPYVDDTLGKCYRDCPTGMYIEPKTSSCEECVSPCKECSSPSNCYSCVSGFFIYENQCFQSCPNTSVPLTSSSTVAECQACKKPCYTCSGLRDNCTSCQLTPTTYYLHENQCVETCPAPYLPNDKNVCEKMDEPTYPFLSLIFTGLLLITILVSNRVYPRTRFFTTILALESVVMVLLWIYLLIFLMKDKHLSSSGLVFIGLIFNFILNVFWYLYYKKKIRDQDDYYRLYQMHYPKSAGTVVFFSFILTFQLFRIIYTRFFDIKSLSCDLQLKHKYYKKLNRYSLLQITFVYLPIIAANFYNLFFTWYGRQVFWIDIECIITTVAMLVAHTIIIYRTEHTYIIAKYDPQNQTTADITTMMHGGSQGKYSKKDNSDGPAQSGQTKGFDFLDGSTPRDGDYKVESEEDEQEGENEQREGSQPDHIKEQSKQMRRDALTKIISKVKTDRDASDLLGVTMEDNQLEITDIDEHNRGATGSNDEPGLDLLVDGQTPGDPSFNKRQDSSQSRAESKKKPTSKGSKGYEHQYLSVGFVGMSTSQKTTAAKHNNKSKIKQVQDPDDDLLNADKHNNPAAAYSSIINKASAFRSVHNTYQSKQKYQKLVQDTSRMQEGDETIEEIREDYQDHRMEFVSAPLNPDQLLKDKEARNKLEKFQDEIEELNKKQIKPLKESPLKLKNKKSSGLVDQQYYHTLGQNETDRGSQNRNRTDDVSEMLPSVIGYNFAQNILKNVVDGQTSHQPGEVPSHQFHSVSASQFQNQDSSNGKSRNQVRGLNSKGQGTIESINPIDHRSKINNKIAKGDFDSIQLDDQNLGEEDKEDVREFKMIQKKLDHRALSNLQKDIDIEAQKRDTQQGSLNQLRSETEDMDSQLQVELLRKEELQVIIDDLQQQIASILQALEDEKERREREIEHIDQANYTSDEEEMAVTPSSYNVLNQRFTDGEDIKIYLNMIGQGKSGHNSRQGSRGENGNLASRGAVNQATSDEMWPDGLEDQIEMEPNAAQASAIKSRSRMNEQDRNGVSQGSKRSFDARRMSGKIVPFGAGDDQSMNSRSQGQLNNDDDDSVSMTKDDFLKMLQQETKDAIQRMRNFKSKEDVEFAKYAESFLKQLTSEKLEQDAEEEVIGGPSAHFKNSSSLLDYIRELDKREKKQIEEKYRKLLGETQELKKKLKKKNKKKKPIKDDSAKFDPYFRYLPFEKAVIESNGRSPFDNKQVEMLATKQKLGAMNKKNQSSNKINGRTSSQQLNNSNGMAKVVNLSQQQMPTQNEFNEDDHQSAIQKEGQIQILDDGLEENENENSLSEDAITEIQAPHKEQKQQSIDSLEDDEEI